VNPFEALVEPHRATLRLHCYRMLGSSHDSDDMVQETFVRAFRARHTLEDPATARAWLYRIATNVCIDELAKRPRRARGPELGPPADPDAPPAARTPDAEWLEPAPSAWLPGAPSDMVSPAAQYTLKESVALAFVAALQVLTPPQRAVLLLRDVVGLSAAETAEALACSVSSANSTLHRARIALEERVGPRADWSPEASAVDRALLERYVRTWEKGDLDAIIALLHDDVTLSMPPNPTWIAGRAGVARFYTNRVVQAVREHRFRTVLVDANGTIGAGFYRLGDDGEWRFFALQVLEAKDGRIRVIDHFMTASSHAAFFAGGLARALTATRQQTLLDENQVASRPERTTDRTTSKGIKAMTTHQTATREKWLAARLELLKAEKELTHRSDAVARQRRELPWVRVEKPYRFETDDGSATLAELFRGRSQVLMYHFMFGPDYSAGCPNCSAIADGFNGIAVHLANHDVMLWAVSRAPLEKLRAYKKRMGWTFPWASSFGSDFNADFHVWFSEEQQRDGTIEYNYHREQPAPEPLAGNTVREWDKREDKGPVAQIAALVGTDMATFTRERPGVSAFALEDGVVYHTYSAFSRGLDGLWGMYQWLDRAPLGRNEKGVWVRHHDKYESGGKKTAE
jgi:RNA polymerase sigma-70 factor (TIGR02960 family)